MIPSPVLWRAMGAEDLAVVMTIADRLHVDHPEDAAVFAERLALAPATCLVAESDGAIGGYAIAHPWLIAAPPALNSRLGSLPERPSTLHVHDVALLPDLRGRSVATAVIAHFADVARQAELPRLSLVAVGGTEVLWRRFGFTEVATTGVGLASYGADARYLATPPAAAVTGAEPPGSVGHRPG
ncbi:GNAT family N-acetyltransferase [Siculibacillus lacustris]|uniref:GNAT family N-acetyltransferase n=1 Tax=Siculibacillus lacustris TaxID=1549641 RepID=A0A4Q9VKN3_9HYPH|nr:GNAT family N-acetyltransferase [Siculibacillus lacustris]TBW35983.1 GNAT family N-acetyltransferase [Siculibacillus lacustris]